MPQKLSEACKATICNLLKSRLALFTLMRKMEPSRRWNDEQH
ncbi:hypothetical protein PMI35_02304 [Pseudomonas sp. GM78]|nr:hypothetical protein PMI35_02304 [Pseudomonas sp. GM78]